MDPSAKPRKVFISYARRDGAELALRLQSDLGANAWLDVQRLRSGDSWEREIETALDEADVVMALLSPGSYASEICRAEQMRALRKEKCVIPLLARPTDFPLHFEARQYLDFTASESYAEQFAKLLRDIRDSPGIAIKAQYRATYVTAPPLPLNFVPREQALESLRDAILSDNSNRHVALTALEGMGGIGKTILAQALCYEQVVQEAFPDGIAWVTLGREGDLDFISKMREVGKALGDDLTHYESYEGCVNRYRTLLREKAALVVVDDVWNAQDLEPFRADSPRSRLLFTTRDAAIAAAVGAREHLAELLTPAQSRGFLARWAGRSESDLPSQSDDLIRECGRLPLALAMIGAMLKRKPDAFWKAVLDLLRRADLARIKAHFPNYPHANLFAAIQVSVDGLDDESRSRYLALAVLLEDIQAAVPILRSLWNADEADAITTAEQFVALSLAQRDRDASAIRLHDLQVDYVRAQYPDQAALKLIHGAMRLSAYVFSQDSHQFASQVTGRLLPHAGKPEVRHLLDTVTSGAPRPWLRPIFPAPIAPGEPLLCTLSVGWINDAASSPDPRRVILAGERGIIVLDLETFREVLSKEGGNVRNVAVRSEAGWAFYANDNGLVVWNPRKLARTSRRRPRIRSRELT